jgi:hypothetical protein
VSFSAFSRLPQQRTSRGASPPAPPTYSSCAAARGVGRRTAPRAASARLYAHDGARELGMKQERLRQHVPPQSGAHSRPQRGAPKSVSNSCATGVAYGLAPKSPAPWHVACVNQVCDRYSPAPLLVLVLLLALVPTRSRLFAGGTSLRREAKDEYGGKRRVGGEKTSRSTSTRGKDEYGTSDARRGKLRPPPGCSHSYSYSHSFLLAVGCLLVGLH